MSRLEQRGFDAHNHFSDERAKVMDVFIVLGLLGVALVAGLVAVNLKARRDVADMTDEEILENDAEEQAW